MRYGYGVLRSQDKVIDPACGSGGFLIEALKQVQDTEFPSDTETWRLVKFANENLYGVDKGSPRSEAHQGDDDSDARRLDSRSCR